MISGSNKQSKNKQSKKRILVIGDIILDKHIYGEVSRISPEAPVPVLRVKKEKYAPGGAANLAANLSSLGSEAYLSGVVGKDNPKERLLKELKRSKINTSLILETSKPTTQKIRGIENQHLFRMDYEDTKKLSEREEDKIIKMIKSKILKIDSIILSDYNKGTLTENLVKNIIKIAKQNNVLVTADCKPQNYLFYKNVDILKPNKKEALEMTSETSVNKAGEKLVKELNSDIVITLGGEGVSVFRKDGSSFNIEATAQRIYDVSGAGDTFLATLTLYVLLTKDLKKSTEIANKASGIVIGKPGVSTITKKELEENF